MSLPSDSSFANNALLMASNRCVCDQTAIRRIMFQLGLAPARCMPLVRVRLGRNGEGSRIGCSGNRVTTGCLISARMAYLEQEAAQPQEAGGGASEGSEGGQRGEHALLGLKPWRGRLHMLMRMHGRGVPLHVLLHGSEVPPACALAWARGGPCMCSCMGAGVTLHVLMPRSGVAPACAPAWALDDPASAHAWGPGAPCRCGGRYWGCGWGAAFAPHIP